MRNDARPIGEDAHDQSPVASHDPKAVPESRPPDHGDPVTHDRQSHIVNQDAEAEAQRVDEIDGDVDRDDRVNRDGVNEDSTMPTGDSTLNTKI